MNNPPLKLLCPQGSLRGGAISTRCPHCVVVENFSLKTHWGAVKRNDRRRISILEKGHPRKEFKFLAELK